MTRDEADLSEFRYDKHITVSYLRDLLIEHIDGKQIWADAPPHSMRRRMLFNLLQRRWIKEENNFTTITDKGREALAKLLAEYANALYLCHLAEQEKPSIGKQLLLITPQGTAHFGDLGELDAA